MKGNMLLYIQVQTRPSNMQYKWKEITDIVYPYTNEKL